MDGACSMCRAQETCIQGFGRGNLTETDHLEDPGVDARIILRCTFGKWDGEMDWIELA